MPRFPLIVFALLGVAGSVSAQQSPVLMRVNGDAITRSDFEAVYPARVTTGKGRKSLDALVDSFVDFRLKVDAAEAAGLDTSRVFREKEVEYRRRLTKRFLSDEQAEEKRIAQAYESSGEHTRTKVWVSQIVHYLPQTTSNYRLQAAEARMDSISRVLQAASYPDFASFVQQFSDNKDTLCLGKFQMLVELEQVASELREGEISKPFFTPQGIHIIKVIRRMDVMPLADMHEELSGRLSRKQPVGEATAAWVERLKGEYSYSPDRAGLEELYANGSTGRALFTLDGKTYTGRDFERFAAGYPLGVKKQYEAFVMKAVLDYENGLLEQKYPDFRRTLNAYRDSLLVSEITYREIMVPLQRDEAGLASFFYANASDYHWKEPRFKGVVLHSSDKKTLKLAKRLVKKFPEEEWAGALKRAFNSPTSEVVQVEQGLYARGSNPYVDKLVFKEGHFTPLKSYPFTAVIGEKQKGPEKLKEVREQVLTDYRTLLETRWVKRLREESKVEINEEVLKTVNNH